MYVDSNGQAKIIIPYMEDDLSQVLKLVDRYSKIAGGLCRDCLSQQYALWVCEDRLQFRCLV
jgi:hypothetical protein